MVVMSKKALITGITGQDGSYLAEFLLEKGYEVHGIVRRVAIEEPEDRVSRIENIVDRVHLHGGTLESYPSVFSIIEKVRPDECFHLGAQSDVAESFRDEFSTMNINANGTHYVLASLRTLAPECRFYFAGTSEMFGKVKESPQNENTPFHPRSPYGVSKVAGFDMTRNYREARDMFACSGILFNHESPRRGYEFVTRKISRYAAMIKVGMEDRVGLGNMDSKRDWGFAGDYVEAMWLMLQQDTPDDFVIATNEDHSVRDFAKAAFDCLDLNYENYTYVDERWYRPADVTQLKGDYSKAKRVLGWQPKVKFEELVEMMVKADYEQFRARVPA
jgi:GDPmannose 4,6-dehydratase